MPIGSTSSASTHYHAQSSTSRKHDGDAKTRKKKSGTQKAMPPPPPPPSLRSRNNGELIGLGLSDSASQAGYKMSHLNSSNRPPVAPLMQNLSPRTQLDMQLARMRADPTYSRKELGERTAEAKAVATQGVSRASAKRRGNAEEMVDIERSVIAARTGNYNGLYPDTPTASYVQDVVAPPPPLTFGVHQDYAASHYRSQYGPYMGASPQFSRHPDPNYIPDRDIDWRS